MNNDNFDEILQTARITRHIAFDTYISKLADTTDNNEMSLILDELRSCIPTFKSRSIMTPNDDENVISLELTSCVETFAYSLSLRDRKVFIRRYFFAESISDIALRYHLSENCVRKIIQGCCNRLKTIFTEKKYRFRAETLFNSFTDINEKLLDEQPKEMVSIEKKLNRAVTIVSSLSLVAFIALILIITLKPSDATNTTKTTDNDALEETTESLRDFAESEFITDNYVNTEVLLNYVPEYIYGSYVTTEIQYGSYIFLYENYELIDNSILKYLTNSWSLTDDDYSNMFSEVTVYGDTTSDWYQLKGHSDMQYLIKEYEGYYSLWKFVYMECDTTNTDRFYYPMSLIYDIYSESDINEIIVSPANMSSNGDYDYSSFAQVSIYTYEDLSYIYYVMSQMTCYGDGNWDLISGYPTHNFSEILEDAVHLEIITPEGEVIDNFYYSDMAGCFFEHDNGIAYSKVSDNARERLYEIFYTELNDTTSYNYVLQSMGINSVADISSISIQNLGKINGQFYYDMITDSDTIKQIYDILSNMTSSPSYTLDESETVDGGMLYQLVIFNSNGASTCAPIYYGTFKCFLEGDIVYNTLSSEECAFFNKLGTDYFRQTEE